uniref:GPI mannosyltransferase 2 n=1 Tax=Globisporangium ultimum (strain ATCC 200006 / CBS 805.95 / DAOM BR144) TaxID=431595 RepID=K3W600_GLOUD
MERQVLQFAVASRAIVSGIAALTTQIVTPYDTSTHLESHSRSLFSAFANWDGVYYAHIARHGYDYEHVHAFFPLYPLLMRALSVILPLEPSIATIVSGWIISNASFVLAALFLYRLGRMVIDNECVARRAAYLFCITPSSIFMSAVYSESFSGMYYLELHKRSGKFKELLYCAMLFGCASATRSNGILLSLYIAWYRLWVSPSPVTTPGRFLRYWMVTAVLGVIVIGPQLAYFVYGMRMYCPSLFDPVTDSQTASSFLVEDRSWCAHVVPNFSAMYMFIQNEYWNIGLFNYYELKQLPNFVLATPVLALSIVSLFQYFNSTIHNRGTCRKQAKQSRVSASSASPYYVHWLVLLVNALLIMHIQVATRFMCACPPLFWAPAAAATASIPQASARKQRQSSPAITWQGKLVVAYFLLFNILGAVLFPSFYPWT